MRLRRAVFSVPSVAKRKMKKEWVFEEVAVECYAGYKGRRNSRAFIYQNRRSEILEVLDRWYEGGMDPPGSAIITLR